MDTPRPTVILPLGDHRGLAVASVRAWVGQTLPAALPALLGLGRGRRAYLEAGPVDRVESYVGGSDSRSPALVDSGLVREISVALAHSIGSNDGRTLGIAVCSLDLVRV